MTRTTLCFITLLSMTGVYATSACSPQSQPVAASSTNQRGEALSPPSPVADAEVPAGGLEDAAIEPSEEALPAAQANQGDDESGNTVSSGAASGDLAPLPANTKVLHVGDSFAGALGIELGKLLEGANVRSVLKSTDASYLTDWAWDGNLQKYLWKYNPELVIVTLGANELGIADAERRERTVKKIVETIGDRPCLWVGIPLWKGPQNGLLDVIERSVEPCVYWDTNALMDTAAMPRIQDGIHPTPNARKEWARIVFDWLRRHRTPEDGRPWALRP